MERHAYRGIRTGTPSVVRAAGGAEQVPNGAVAGAALSV